MTNWLSHVKKTMKMNKGKPLKEVLKIAKASYKTVEKAVSASVKSAKKATKTVRKTLRVGGAKKHTKTQKMRKH